MPGERPAAPTGIALSNIELPCAERDPRLDYFGASRSPSAQANSRNSSFGYSAF